MLAMLSYTFLYGNYETKFYWNFILIILTKIIIIYRMAYKIVSIIVGNVINIWEQFLQIAEKSIT